MTEKGRSPFFFVTLSSSSLAYAVSILPFGKMHDLQGGSSSSQKSRCAAIFGSPVFSRSRMGLARKRIGKQTLLPCSEQLTVLYKIPRLTLGMTGIILFSEILNFTFYILHFTFQKEIPRLGRCAPSLRMTGRGEFRRFAPQDDRNNIIFRDPQFYILHSTFYAPCVSSKEKV